jgi:hypothetical protein
MVGLNGEYDWEEGIGANEYLVSKACGQRLALNSAGTGVDWSMSAIGKTAVR